MEVFGQLLLAAVLGAVVGLERGAAGKTAGMRTYALVSLGSALFSLMSILAFRDIVGVSSIDPSRIAAQIVVGIGFIGAGTIIFNNNKVQGTTTAAGLWVVAAIGMAVAFRFYSIAIVATLITLFIFIILWYLEQFLVKRIEQKHQK